MAFSGGNIQGQEDPAWFTDWGIEEGFSISLDTDGYDMPSAIAFVPNPGDNPGDPLYFVNELRGKIVVVTNDRNKHIFVEDIFQNDSELGLNNMREEFGLSGICLDSNTGYIFITYSYRNNEGNILNGITRFSTEENIFSIKPAGTLIFEHPFLNFPTRSSHVIGGCQIDEGMLYVGIGDGVNLYDLPLGIDNPLGKILRFTLDGEPETNNPFYSEDNPLAPSNFVWAMGFRNPYGVKIVNGQVFVAENGKHIDRFLRVEAAGDYLWDGSDYSIGARANLVFSPAIAPTQLEFYSEGSQLFPALYDDSFFVAATGNRKGIVRFPYDFDRDAATGPSSYFLTYLGREDNFYSGMVTGLAVGPDGLYFAPIVSSQASTTGVFKIIYDPQNQHPYRSNDLSNPAVLIRSLDCTACHVLRGTGSSIGPSLDYGELIPRLEKRLNSEEYRQILEDVDALDTEPFISYTLARQEVRELEGKTKIIKWISFHLLEPMFDNPEAQMPNLNLSKRQANVLAEYLTTNQIAESESQTAAQQPRQNSSEDTSTAAEENEFSFISKLMDALPTLRYRHLPFIFLAGVLSTMIFIRIYKK